ncbi:MAG: hypothetical protein M1826_007126 [Phylliscum demangeonii]|nr:MAG: hypothetical protein M1826_007126 [Phylliscum demangeonii]
MHDGDPASAPAPAPVLPQAPSVQPPGGLPPDTPGLTEPIAVPKMNDLYFARTQAVNDRLEAEARGWTGVFSH